MTFPEEVKNILPPDDELVMGTVVSGNPLIVSARGAQLKPGRLSTTGLTTGDTVALIRQDATWLALGKMITGAVTGLGLTSLQMSQLTPAVLGLVAAEADVPGTTITFTTTAPNAIVYSSGHIPITAMMKYGLALDLFAYVVIVAAVMLLGPVLF